MNSQEKNWELMAKELLEENDFLRELLGAPKRKRFDSAKESDDNQGAHSHRAVAGGRFGPA